MPRRARVVRLFLDLSKSLQPWPQVEHSINMRGKLWVAWWARGGGGAGAKPCECGAAAVRMPGRCWTLAVRVLGRCRRGPSLGGLEQGPVRAGPRPLDI